MKRRLRRFFGAIVGADEPVPRWLRALVCAALLALAFWYVRAAVRHGEARNTIAEYNDQRVYLNYARSFAVMGWEFTTPRMRMPLYGGILSLAADDQAPGSFDQSRFFLEAQRFNVGLSLVCLVVMYLFLRRWVGDWFGLCLILMTAFQLYLLRSAYVQPELLLTTIITITTAQLIETLRHPRWWNAVLSGVLLCLWFLTKASAQGMLGIFGIFLIAKWLTAGPGRRRPYFVAGILVLVGYLVPMSPYLHGSWKIFGSPFYNAQSRYFMWAETDADKHYLQSLHLDVDLSALPQDSSQVPGAAKYLREHSLRSIKDRIKKGREIMFKLAFLDYPLLYFMVAFWAGVVLWGFCRRWDEAVPALWRWKWEALFVAAFLSVFVLLFGWFSPIHVGPRLIVSVTIPALFVLVALAHWLLKEEVEVIGGLPVSLEKMVGAGFLIFWALATALQAPADMATGFFAG